MGCKLTRFKSKDNLELQGLLYEPEKRTKRAIIHVHGWIGNFYQNSFIDPIAQSALNENIAFFSFNNRGEGIVNEFRRNGETEEIGGSLEKFKECVYDIGGAINCLESKSYEEIILQGHSLGCQKAAYYQNRKKDNRVKSLVLLSPVDDVEYTSKCLLSKEKYEESLKIAREMVESGRGQEPVPEWMQFYPLLSANMFLQVSDPKSESGRLFDYSGDLSELKSIDVPILAVFGSEDDYQIEPAEKLKIIKDKIGCSTALIKDGDHWFASHEKELARQVLSWVVEKVWKNKDNYKERE